MFVGIAAALLLALFRDAWLRGEVLGQADFLFGSLPWSTLKPVGWRIGNPLLGDVPLVFYPFALEARTAVLGGTFPLWSSAVGAGEPLFASFQSAVLSPFSLLVYALPFPASLTAVAAARLFVGGLGMYLFLKRLPLSTEAAVFGGIAYLLNPFSVVWLEHPLSAVAAWLPWLLLGVDACATRPSGRAVAGVAAATACALLSGHPETCFELILLAGAYACYRGATTGRWLRTPAMVLAGGALGLLIASIQLLPFLEYLQVSRIMAARAGAIEPHFTNPPASFVTAFVPDFFGSPLGPRFIITGTNYCEQQVYPGIATWAFAGASLCAARHRGTALFFIVAALAAALIMYGTPVARIAVLLIPPLRVAALSRFGLLVIAAVAVCGAIGVEALLHPERSRAARLAPVCVLAGALVMAGVVFAFFHAQQALLVETRQWTRAVRGAQRFAELLTAAAVLAVLPRWLPRAAAAALMIALLSADLFLFADGFHPLIPREHAFPPVAEFDAVRQDPDIFRIAGWGNMMLPNTAMVYGLQDVRVYDGVGIARYGELLDIGFRFNGSEHLLVTAAVAPLIDLLNLKYILAPRDLDLPADRYTLVRDGPTRVYRNDRAQPRAFLADDTVVLQGSDALRAIRDGAVDLTHQAVIDAPMDPATRPEPSAGQIGVAIVRSYRNDRVRIETSAGGRRLLVLTDVFYPGWRARVDGVEAPIIRTNYAFRAVALPAGRHVVEFRYEPRSFQAGGLASLAGLIVFAAALRWRHVDA